ncbi:MAG: long-chain fatty acid--CoA ligase, partial [Rhodospirillaceae bacterium]
NIKMHTVGPPLRGVEILIAEDGEILARGPMVMDGYWNDPDSTAQAIDAEACLHTGDIGKFDEDGYLQITDRKKDIIVNSGGDNISPQRIEGILCLEAEIAQAMVYGDKKPHLVALLVPDTEFLTKWAHSKGKSKDLAALCEDEDLRKELSAVLDRSNKALSSIEKVRRFVIAKEPFSTDNSQMTPTLKVRRHVVKEVYGEALEALYSKKG